MDELPLSGGANSFARRRPRRTNRLAGDGEGIGGKVSTVASFPSVGQLIYIDVRVHEFGGEVSTIALVPQSAGWRRRRNWWGSFHRCFLSFSRPIYLDRWAGPWNWWRSFHRCIRSSHRSNNVYRWMGAFKGATNTTTRAVLKGATQTASSKDDRAIGREEGACFASFWRAIGRSLKVDAACRG